MATGATKALAAESERELLRAFLASPLALLGAALTVVLVALAVLAPWIAPQDVLDPSVADLMDAFTPPAWLADGQARFPLGTDDQGRDLLSAVLLGLRLSLLIGVVAMALAAVLGTLLGLVAGYRGGVLDAVIMRAADIQLTIPALLTALLLNGALRAVLPGGAEGGSAVAVLILAIGLAEWPKLATLARVTARGERDRDYVAAARLIGVRPGAIILRHILPNVLGRMLVVAAIGLPVAIIAEASMSFLGVGLPPTTPSLGTLIRIGNNFMLSGEWWIAAFPAATLVLLVLGVNLVCDWSRDMLDPRLRRTRSASA